jgi:hypothetical protein
MCRVKINPLYNKNKYKLLTSDQSIRRIYYTVCTVTCILSIQTSRFTLVIFQSGDNVFNLC